MPLIHQIKKDNYCLVVWKVTETASDLGMDIEMTPEEFHHFNNIKLEKRKLEWLAVRKILNVILENRKVSINYDTAGKPHLSDKSRHISIAHSAEFVAVLASHAHHVGLDIEKISGEKEVTENRIENISHKFLNEKEEAFVHNITANLNGDKTSSRVQLLYIIWGIKEAIFKIYSKGGVDFKKNILVEPFTLAQPGKANARLQLGDVSKMYELNFVIEKEWIVVYVVDEE